MTPTDKRVKELIDRWLTSLELHMQYADLNDSAYNKVQPWPVHDRPTKWVLEMARQKTLELQSALEWRIAMGDTNFSESLEQAISLANLVGLQHIKRFIPLAEPERHGKSTLTDLDNLDAAAAAAAPRPAAPVAAPSPPPVAAPPPAAPMPPPATTSAVLVAPARPTAPAAPPVVKPAPPPVQPPAQTRTQHAAPAPAMPAAPVTPPAAVTTPATVKPPAARPAPPPIAPARVAQPHVDPANGIEATREMPRLQRVPPKPVPAPAPVKAPPQAAAPKAPPAPPPVPAPKATVTDSKMVALVMDDAVRLINWGRPWHELPEAIARLADRPKAPEVRRILRASRAEIEQRAKDESETDDDKKKKKKR